MIYLSADYSPAIEPVDLPEVRAFLGMVGGDTSEDHLLTSVTAQARQAIEDLLPFWLAERKVITTDDSAPMLHLKGDVALIYSVVGLKSDGTESDVTSECHLRASPMGSRLTVAHWEDFETVEVTFRTLPYVSESMNLAVLMAVRSLYGDRTADPITDAVRRIIEPYQVVNI